MLPWLAALGVSALASGIGSYMAGGSNVAQKKKAGKPAARGGGGGGSLEGKLQKFELYTPEQKKAMNQLLKTGIGAYDQMGKPIKFEPLPAQGEMPGIAALRDLTAGRQQYDFAPIEQRALEQYRKQTLPGIAEMFAGGDALSSGAFLNQLAGSGSDLQSQLAALRSQYNIAQRGQEFQEGSEMNRSQLARDALLNQLYGQRESQNLARYGIRQQQQMFPFQQASQRANIGLNAGLGQQFQNAYFPKQPPTPSAWETAAPSLLGGLGAGLGQIGGGLAMKYLFGL